MYDYLADEDCPVPDGFSSEEAALLRRHLRFYRSLETGERRPTTEAQHHFVAVCEGRAAPTTEHERVYAKFMHYRPKPEAVEPMDWRDRYDREH